MDKKTNTKEVEQVKEELVPTVESKVEAAVETVADEQTVETVKEPEIIEDTPKKVKESNKAGTSHPNQAAERPAQVSPTFKSDYNYIWNGIGY